MTKSVVVLLAKESSVATEIDWSDVGTVTTEISELYQYAKERDIDLVLVDRARKDLKMQVATRIRRYNGLTEIWRIVHSVNDLEPEESYVDGHLSVELGERGVVEKVAQILRSKDLLARYRIVGRSAKIKLVAETIDRIAPTEVPVLVVGPSGSGKELVARAIHANSLRKAHPFVAINCGALAEGVLESELFGHEKGAFTGSVGKREGLFKKADRGTIFLDEIGETKQDTQVKLLRVLEDGTFYPVGSSTAEKSDVRVVSATNRDLTEAIAERQFREDLYFRIGVVKIILPPLYERKGDIQPLLQHFWREQAGLSYTDSALELLTKYDWPGNVRELRNFAERMIALNPSGRIELEDVEQFIREQHNTSVSNLPVSTGKSVEEAGQELIYRAIMSLGTEIRMLRDLITANLPSEEHIHGFGASFRDVMKNMSMDDMEQVMIEQALEDSKGNRKEAARKLGIGERTLYRKIKQYNLS